MSNVPKLRFKEFSGEWEEKSLKDLTKINQGLQIPIADRFTEQVENSYFYITNEFLKETSSNKYFIKNPPESVLCTESDVLMTRTGNTGQVVTNVNGAFHNNFFKIKYSDDLNKNFLVEFLRLVDTQNMIMRYAGTSTIPDLNHGDFYKLKLNLPSKQEQEKIALFLTSVNAKIEQLTKKEELLKQYKKGVMQQIFSGEIRFKADDGSEFEDWKEKKLGDVAYITTGKSNREDSGTEGQYTFFDRSEDIRTSDIYLFDKEAIIVAGEGSDFPPKYFKGKFDLHQRTYAIMDFVNGDAKYLLYYIHYHKSYFVRYAVGSTVKSLRLPIFQQMDIKLPCLEEQTKIANFLSSIDYKIEQVSAQLDSTKEFKKALLQQMFV